jgi:hypothetical protein
VDTPYPEIRRLFEDQGISNPDLPNESLTTVELGYQGSFFDARVRLNLDGYLAFNRNMIGFDTYIHIDSMAGMPQIDVDKSVVGFEAVAEDTNAVGLTVGIEAVPLEGLDLFFRMDVRHGWAVDPVEEGQMPILLRVPELIVAAGGIYEYSSGPMLGLRVVHIGSYRDTLRHPDSVLSASIEGTTKARTVVIAHGEVPVKIGKNLLHLGMSLLNPFGGHFREKIGVPAADGSNYGGELQGPRAMFTARWRY